MRQTIQRKVMGVVLTLAAAAAMTLAAAFIDSSVPRTSALWIGLVIGAAMTVMGGFCWVSAECDEYLDARSERRELEALAAAEMAADEKGQRPAPPPHRSRPFGPPTARQVVVYQATLKPAESFPRQAFARRAWRGQ